MDSDKSQAAPKESLSILRTGLPETLATRTRIPARARKCSRTLCLLLQCLFQCKPPADAERRISRRVARLLELLS